MMLLKISIGGKGVTGIRSNEWEKVASNRVGLMAKAMML